LQGEAEVVLQVEDADGGRGVGLLNVGAVGGLHVGVVDPAAFADAFELYVGRIEDALLEAL